MNTITQNDEGGWDTDSTSAASSMDGDLSTIWELASCGSSDSETVRSSGSEDADHPSLSPVGICVVASTNQDPWEEEMTHRAQHNAKILSCVDTNRIRDKRRLQIQARMKDLENRISAIREAFDHTTL